MFPVLPDSAKTWATMNKPQPVNWLLPLIFGGIVLIGIGLYVQRPREFEHQGKRLTRWLDELDPSQPPEKRDAAREAVRQMGTNIVPSLLAMLKSMPSYSTRQLASSLSQTEYAHRRALGGFQALGSVALPALTKFLERAETATTAAHALCQIGREGIPALIHALTNESAVIRQKVELGLEASGPDGQALVAVLVGNLKDNDSHVRACAAGALGRLSLGAEVAVPALSGTLQDSSPEVRTFAAESLGEFGPKAKGAILPLLSVANDKDPQVSAAVFKALAQIDPDAARKAGVK